YNNLENAVARGARYGALVPYDSANSTPSDAYSAAVKNMVVYGTPTPAVGANAGLTGLTTPNVTAQVAFDSTYKIPGTVTVSITNYTINGIFGTTLLTNKPSVTYQYQGVWSPI